MNLDDLATKPLTSEERQTLHVFFASPAWLAVQSLLDRATAEAFHKVASTPDDHRYYQGVYKGVNLLRDYARHLQTRTQAHRKMASLKGPRP